jgi:magnesium transporter
MKLLDNVDADAIRALHERGEFFWLDLHTPSDAEIDQLGALLHIPELAVEDTKEFGQRPKLDDYASRVLLVFYGAHEFEAVEVHVHVSGDEVVTVRHAECAHLGAVKERVREGAVRSEQELVYLILDALADSLRALSDRYAAEVDQLEDVAFVRPTAANRRRISELRAELFRLQQIVVPQRELLARGSDLLETLPGLEHEDARHRFRDVHDDLVLTANQIDYLREVLSETVTVLINQLTGRLTIVATIFLPLTFATGFFGMNFGWLVDHIDSAWTFFAFGVGGMILPLVVAGVLLVRAGYVTRR